MVNIKLSKSPRDKPGVSYIIRLLVALLLVTSTGCSYLSSFSKDNEFDGLIDDLVTSNGSGGMLHLLVVHGMGLHEPGYSDEMIGRIADNLLLSESHAGGQERDERIFTAIENKNFQLGSIRTRDYDGEKGKMRVYELVWSPAVTIIKNRYLGFDNTDQIRNRRLRVNRALKEELINQRLADPVLYLGSYKPFIQIPTEHAICWIFTGKVSGDIDCEFDDPPAFVPGKDVLSVITYSLGSRIFFDTFHKIGQKSDWITVDQISEFEGFTGSTAKVFMLANQLPLLGLGEVEDHEDDDVLVALSSDENVVPDLPLSVKSILGQSDMEVVAFSDPNDLLSYPVPQYFSDNYPDRFHNVSLNIAKIGYLFVFANPVKAHTGYDKNRRVIDLISCGTSSSC